MPLMRPYSFLCHDDCCGAETPQLAAVGHCLPVEACMQPSATMGTGPQGGAPRSAPAHAKSSVLCAAFQL